MSTPDPTRLPTGCILRPASLQDFDSVLRLCAAQNIADYDQPGPTPEALRENWQSPTFHIGLDHWLVLDPQGRPAAYAEMQDLGGRTSFQAVLAVPGPLPCDGDGQAAAAALLEQIHRRAGELAGPSASIGFRVSTRSAPFCQLLESAGYQRTLTFNIMEADLTQPPAAPALPASVTIRAFVPGADDQAVYRADEEASEDKGYHEPMTYEAWCRRMGRHTPFFDPSLWFLAFSGGELAGAALNFYHSETQTGWVDHLGVRRAFRKQGIGMALLLHALIAFRQRGYPAARLSVDSHSLTRAPRLYERAGFHTVLGYHIYEKQMAGPERSSG